MSLKDLKQAIEEHFGQSVMATNIALNELTIDVAPADLHRVCLSLRDEKSFQFDTLIDVCGVDYLHYGMTEWDTQKTTETGFSRAVDKARDKKFTTWEKSRFGVIYHLLSVRKNRRLRLRIFLEEDALEVDSVTDVWASANWFEREAFDLFGIIFKNHPDLRRILTDYGFVGYPFRKDFPLIGEVEMRYDADAQKCIYQPVTIRARVTVPKVIREDHRYAPVLKTELES